MKTRTANGRSKWQKEARGRKVWGARRKRKILVREDPREIPSVSFGRHQ